MSVEGNTHKQANMIDLEVYYRSQPPLRRRVEHHAAIMYRLSKNGHLLDTFRPKIDLRSHRKVKFKHPHRNM